MSFDLMEHNLFGLSFREGVWLFPIVFTLHVLEELPRFTEWARRYASERFTHQDYLRVHSAGPILSPLSAGAISLFPNQWTVLCFFALVFAPAVLFNSLFHAGATLQSGAYCPGLFTAISLYLPVFYILCRLALREGLLSNNTMILGLLVAGVFHAVEVGHNLYKAW